MRGGGLAGLVAEPVSMLEALLLGAIQGVTEWLPVSSSGHLVLAQELLGIEASLFFDLLLHVATVGVIVVFYRERVGRVLRAVVETPGAVREEGWRAALGSDPDRRLATLVVAGSVPTAVVGFGLEGPASAWFSSLLVVGVALIATGLWLALTRLAPATGVRALGLGVALAVGLAQGLAVIPGVSRSGATIGAALLLGVEREAAVEFSFLLGVPAILGAAVFQADREALAAAGANLPAVLAGVVVAAVVGYAALTALVWLVERRVFHRFAWYCIPVGVAVVVASTL